MKDVVSELALHAECKMIIFMSAFFNFWRMIMAPGLLGILQKIFPFFKFYTRGPFLFK